MRDGQFKRMILPLAVSVLVGVSGGIAAKEEVTEKPPVPGGIVTFDIVYKLFDLLGTYHDLSQAEEQRHVDMGRALVPVLEEIIQEFGKEKAKYQALSQGKNPSPEMAGRLGKIEKLLADFSKELRYRRTVLQYQLLLEQQKTLIQGE